MRSRRYRGISGSVKREVVDPAEFFYVVELGLIVVPVVISLDDIEKIFLISHRDGVIILVSVRNFPALGSGCDPADSEHGEHDQKCEKGCAKCEHLSCACSGRSSGLDLSCRMFRAGPAGFFLSESRLFVSCLYYSEIIHHTAAPFNSAAVRSAGSGSCVKVSFPGCISLYKCHYINIRISVTHCLSPLSTVSAN